MSRILLATTFLGAAAVVLWTQSRLLEAGGSQGQTDKQAGTGKPATAHVLPRWIWQGPKGLPNQVVLFRKEITVSGPITRARLAGTCDNEMIVFVNGKEVLRSTEWSQPVAADVTAALEAGKNVIAVRAKNDESSDAGLLLKLEIESKGQPPQVVMTDGTWAVAAKAPKGWQKLKFDASRWAKATVVGQLGDQPWVKVNPTTLAAARQPQESKVSFLTQIKAAKDFKVDLIYKVPPAQGSWVSLTVDPRGRLIASDQYGKLYRITPPATDAATASQVELLPLAVGEAQGLLYANNSLYVVVNGHGRYKSGLYRVRGTADGELGDKVELLQAINGGGEHGPHAVLLGPDGQSLYVLCGNHTQQLKRDSSRVPPHYDEDSLLPRMWDASGHAVGIMAPGGVIYKTDLDGKKWELWCNGFRNEYDAAFNRDGELFSYDSDMEWDINTPWYVPTRALHCVSGAEFGWRGGTGKFPSYYPDTLPAVYNVGPGSPTGMTFGYGAKFPAKYQDALFMCDWSYGKLYALHLTPDGASYKGTLEEFVKGTPLPLTDIVVNPKDGALYFAVGGRKTESGLYRVTYIGTDSTAPSQGSKEGAEARALRHKLEAFHGKKDAQAIEVCWPYLGHADRFIRWAARVAIEHQNPKLWQDKALAEKNPQAAVEALLALSRCGDKSLQPQLLEALDRIGWKGLTEAQKLALLRVYSLAMIRMGHPDDTATARLIQKFDRLYPAPTFLENTQLCRLLVYLQAPSAAAKTLALLRKAVTQEEELEYILSLRNLKNGWTRKEREEFFRWFLKAANYKGGNSFAGFVRNIKADAVAQLPAAEKVALKPILEAKPKVQPPTVFPPRPFVKDWKTAELVKLVEKKGLKNRNFEQGRTVFAAASCFACHRFANQGGSTGPDLTGAGGRFTPHDLIESITEPSKVISDQYQSHTFVLDDGRVVTGRVVNLFGDNMSIMVDGLDPNKLVNVDRKHVDSFSPSPISMMPNGLLNTFHDEEILDLLAYLIAGGDRSNAMFRPQDKGGR